VSAEPAFNDRHDAEVIPVAERKVDQQDERGNSGAARHVAIIMDGNGRWARKRLLPRVVGHKRAMELLLLNRALDAAEALEWGLVNEVVDDAGLLGRAVELGERLAHGPGSAFGVTKRLIAHSLGGLESQLVLESEAIAAQARSADATEGIGAFLEKRKPRFPGSAA